MHATVAGADPRDGEDDDSGAEVKKRSSGRVGLGCVVAQC
jgi:hypothetical protein